MSSLSMSSQPVCLTLSPLDFKDRKNRTQEAALEAFQVLLNHPLLKKNKSFLIMHRDVQQLKKEAKKVSLEHTLFTEEITGIQPAELLLKPCLQQPLPWLDATSHLLSGDEDHVQLGKHLLFHLERATRPCLHAHTVSTEEDALRLHEKSRQDLVALLNGTSSHDASMGLATCGYVAMHHDGFRITDLGGYKMSSAAAEDIHHAFLAMDMISMSHGGHTQRLHITEDSILTLKNPPSIRAYDLIDRQYVQARNNHHGFHLEATDLGRAWADRISTLVL